MDEESGQMVTPIIKRILSEMRSKGETIRAFRDNRGRLRHVIGARDVILAQTVDAMRGRGLIELVEQGEELKHAKVVHYRLKK